MLKFAEFILEKKKFLKTKDEDIYGYIDANSSLSVAKTIQDYLSKKEKSGEDTFSSFSAETERKIKLWCRTIAIAFDVECIFIVSEDSVYIYKHEVSEYKARKYHKDMQDVIKLKPETIENDDTLKAFCARLTKIKGKEAKTSSIDIDTKFSEIEA